LKVRNSILRRVLFQHLIDIGENNVSGPQADPHIDFAWIGSSPSMRENNILSELEKLFFCKASVIFKLLGKTMFQVPTSIHILILRGLEAVQAVQAVI
jgi:hypothetical protein